VIRIKERYVNTFIIRYNFQPLKIRVSKCTINDSKLFRNSKFTTQKEMKKDHEIFYVYLLCFTI
jgi:hypothetical protein